MDVYMNMYVFEAVIPQIEAILCCTPKNKRIRIPHFRCIDSVPQCAVFPHTPAHRTLRSLLLFFHFFLVNLHLVAFEIWSISDVFFSSSEAKSRKNVLPAGRLQRGPPVAPPAPPPRQPGGGRSRRDRFRFGRNHQCTRRGQCTGI